MSKLAKNVTVKYVSNSDEFIKIWINEIFNHIDILEHKVDWTNKLNVNHIFIHYEKDEKIRFKLSLMTIKGKAYGINYYTNRVSGYIPLDENKKYEIQIEK